MPKCGGIQRKCQRSKRVDEGVVNIRMLKEVMDAERNKYLPAVQCPYRHGKIGRPVRTFAEEVKSDGNDARSRWTSGRSGRNSHSFLKRQSLNVISGESI